MKKRQLNFTTSTTEKLPPVPVVDLARHIEDWLQDCQILQHSPRSNEIRAILLGKLLWFLHDRGYEVCDLSALRRFFAYLTTGHEAPGGRWGNAQLTKPLRPATVQNYHKHLRTFFNWLVKDSRLD